MTERRYEFDGRPTRREALEIVRAALDDEGLDLGKPGQSARVREGIDAQGRYWIAVPDALVLARPGCETDT